MRIVFDDQFYNGMLRYLSLAVVPEIVADVEANARQEILR